VTTAYTSKGVHDCRLLDDAWIVDDPEDLKAVTGRMLAEG
jgi:hypothetical protein